MLSCLHLIKKTIKILELQNFLEHNHFEANLQPKFNIQCKYFQIIVQIKTLKSMFK
jgi:hypothetical protein